MLYMSGRRWGDAARIREALQQIEENRSEGDRVNGSAVGGGVVVDEDDDSGDSVELELYGEATGGGESPVRYRNGP